MEDLLITKETKYRKEPYFNALNSCVEFETLISLGGRSEGNQNEKRYIALINDLFELESKGQIRPTVLTSHPPTTLFAPLLPVRQEGKTHAVLCHRRGVGSEGKNSSLSKPLEFKKHVT